MNYKSFTQIVILGSSAFVPFMQLPTSHRREVIEDLLDIKIFSSMNTVIKEKIRKIRDEVKTLELKKESLFDKVEMQKNFIEELENRGNANINANKEKDFILKKIEEFHLKEIDKDKLYKFLREMEFNRLLSSVISAYGEPELGEITAEKKTEKKTQNINKKNYHSIITCQKHNLLFENNSDAKIAKGEGWRVCSSSSQFAMLHKKII